MVAHEVSHAWTGNLITNHTWEHFWLNEGWTVWLERRILQRVSGAEIDEYVVESPQRKSPSAARSSRAYAHQRQSATKA